jgi:hypothetical protein
MRKRGLRWIDEACRSVALRRAVQVAALALWLAESAPLAHAQPRQQPADSAAPLSAAQQYEQGFVEVEQSRIGGYSVAGTGLQPGGYVLPVDDWRAFRGRPRKQLGLLEFYDAVDRPDLRQSAVTHTILRVSFTVVGVGLLIGGGVYEYVSYGKDPPHAPLGGWIAIGAGLACVTTAYILGPQTLDGDEAEGLARAHNHRLRLQLGLPSLDQQSSRADRWLPIARAPAARTLEDGLSGLSVIATF